MHINMNKLKIALAFGLLLFFVACSDDDPAPPAAPTGSMTPAITIAAGETGILSGNFADPIGIRTIAVTGTTLTLNETIDGEEATSFDLQFNLTISEDSPAGEYEVTTTVTNTGNVSAEFKTIVTVTEAPQPPTGSIIDQIAIVAGETEKITGSFTDNLGITSLTLTSSDLTINEVFDGGDVTSYELDYDLTIDASTPSGDYTLITTVTNSSDLVTEFSTTISVSDPPQPPSGTMTDQIEIVAGEAGRLTGSFSDNIGIASITLSSDDLTVNEEFDGGGATNYDLTYDLTIDETTPAGNYTLTTLVANTNDLLVEFTTTVIVTEPLDPCTLDPFDDTTANAASSFTDSNDDYYFEDYTNEFTGIGLSIDDDCQTITITGDFLDWGTIDESFTPVLNLSVTATDDNTGTLSFTEEVMGAMSDGFTYRMSTTGENGAYNISDGIISFSVYVDYDVNGEWVRWYTNTTTLTIQ